MDMEQNILSQLKRTVQIDKEFDLLNVYKGVPLLYRAAVLKIGEGQARLYTRRYEATCLAIEKRTTILNKTLDEPVTADVDWVELATGEANLVRFRYGSARLSERMILRVEPRDRIEVGMEIGERRLAGRLMDLSINGLALQAPWEGEAPGAGAVVALTLPLPEATLNLTGAVRHVRQMDSAVRLGITFLQDAQTPAVLRYLHQRQDEILEELRALHAQASPA